ILFPFSPHDFADEIGEYQFAIAADSSAHAVVHEVSDITIAMICRVPLGGRKIVGFEFEVVVDETLELGGVGSGDQPFFESAGPGKRRFFEVRSWQWQPPQANAAVGAGAQDTLAVGKHAKYAHLVAAGVETTELGAAGGIPDSDDFIV